MAFLIHDNICIISIDASATPLEISIDVIQSDQYNHLTSSARSNNETLFTYEHWLEIVDVYSPNDEQPLRELPKKSVLRIFPGNDDFHLMISSEIVLKIHLFEFVSLGK